MPATNCAIGCETKHNWLGTFRGRVGYAFDRFLPYFTGGVALGEVQANLTGFPAATETRTGWTIGGGMEYAFITNWTMKLEYLYVDLGSMQCPAASCGTVTDVSYKTNILRGGLNYKF